LKKWQRVKRGANFKIWFINVSISKSFFRIKIEKEDTTLGWTNFFLQRTSRKEKRANNKKRGLPTWYQLDGNHHHFWIHGTFFPKSAAVITNRSHASLIYTITHKAREAQMKRFHAYQNHVLHMHVCNN
jgi:hypothetical protein